MQSPKARTLPPEIIKACLILGISSEAIKDQMIRDAWKRQVSAMARIGDSESAVHLLKAKETLIEWLRGAKMLKTHLQQGCGSWQGPPPPPDPDHPSRVPRRPLPTAGAGEIALPEPRSDTSYGTL
jgi:hypothetical protein